MAVWVQLTVKRDVDVRGVRQTFHPGDWVSVGKHCALLWQQQGACVIPGMSGMEEYAGGTKAGVCVTGEEQAAQSILTERNNKLPVQFSIPYLYWPKTLIWHPPAMLRVELMPAAFELLNIWQVLCPLCDYRVRAFEIGTDDERERTRRVIRDLRVKVYDTGLIYVRRCSETERLIEVWREEMTDHGDERLSFLRALYRTKPLVLALPITWTGHQVGEM